MAEGAANALLPKTLESQERGVLILLSSAPERLLATIRSRCQQASPSARLDATAMARCAWTLTRPQSSQPGSRSAGAAGSGRRLSRALLHHREQVASPARGCDRLLEGSPAPSEPCLARDLARPLTLQDQQLWADLNLVASGASGWAA